MNEQRYIKIISFVGLTGSGKSSAARYLAERGYPKVVMDPDGAENHISTEEALKQIHGIADAGQRHAVIDGPSSWDAYKALRAEFPGVITIAVTTPRYIRHHRLAKRPSNPLSGHAIDQHDYEKIEKNNVGGVVAIADFYVTNGGSTEQLHVQIDDLLKRTEL